MPIKFRSSAISEPFIFDSVGNHWPQEAIRRHKGYPYYHYLQTEKGRGRIEFSDQSFLLEENEGVLIAPFVPHSYSALEPGWLTAFATFTGTLEDSISKMLENRPIIYINKEQGSQIASLLESVMLKYEITPVDNHQLSVDCYHLLMHFIKGSHDHSFLEDPSYQRYVAPVIQEIETHYDQPLTVQMLSSHVFVTPQYLSRLFVRFLGCSVYDYLLNHRIQRAKELLLSPTRQEIQEIAIRTGFASSSHFISLFKKSVGLTPGEFRRMN